MAILQGNFDFQPITTTYVPLPIQQMQETLGVLEKKYHTNKAEIDRFEILAKTDKILEDADPVRRRAIQRMKERTADVINEGNYEDADLIVSEMAKEYLSDPDMILARENYAKRQKDLERIRELKDRGEYVYDFNENFSSFDEETGEQRAYASDYLIYDNKIKDTMEQMFDDMPSLSWNTLTPSDIQGILTNKTFSGISKKRIKDYVNDAFNRYSGTTQYQNHREWLKRTKNMTDEEANEEIKKELLGTGMERAGVRSTLSYEEDPQYSNSGGGSSDFPPFDPLATTVTGADYERTGFKDYADYENNVNAVVETIDNLETELGNMSEDNPNRSNKEQELFNKRIELENLQAYNESVTSSIAQIVETNPESLQTIESLFDKHRKRSARFAESEDKRSKRLSEKVKEGFFPQADTTPRTDWYDKSKEDEYKQDALNLAATHKKEELDRLIEQELVKENPDRELIFKYEAAKDISNAVDVEKLRDETVKAGSISYNTYGGSEGGNKGGVPVPLIQNHNNVLRQNLIGNNTINGTIITDDGRVIQYNDKNVEELYGELTEQMFGKTGLTRVNGKEELIVTDFHKDGKVGVRVTIMGERLGKSNKGEGLVPMTSFTLIPEKRGQKQVIQSMKAIAELQTDNFNKNKLHAVADYSAPVDIYYSRNPAKVNKIPLTNTPLGNQLKHVFGGQEVIAVTTKRDDSSTRYITFENANGEKVTDFELSFEDSTGLMMRLREAEKALELAMRRN